MATVVQGRGAGVFDNSVMFISSGTVTRGTTMVPASGLKIRGTPPHGLAARVVLPQTPATTCKIRPEIHASADDTNYKLVAAWPGGYLSGPAAGGMQEAMIPFNVPSGYPYVKLGFSFVGGTTGDSFGAVLAGIVPHAQGDWTRAIRND